MAEGIRETQPKQKKGESRPVHLGRGGKKRRENKIRQARGQGIVWKYILNTTSNKNKNETNTSARVTRGRGNQLGKKKKNRNKRPRSKSNWKKDTSSSWGGPSTGCNQTQVEP